MQETDTGIAKSISGFLLWLASVLASVTALSYATGFMVIRTHGEVLGISQFIEPTLQSCITTGSFFVINTILDIVPAVARILDVQESLIASILFWVFISIGAITTVIQKIRRKRNLPVQEEPAPINTISFPLPWGLKLICGVIFIFLLVAIEHDKRGKNLLTSSGNAIEIVQRSNTEYLKQMDRIYQNKVLLVVLSGLLMALILKGNSDHRWTTEAVRLSLYFLFIVDLLFLVTYYGQYQYHQQFNEITDIVFSEDLALRIPPSTSLWLIHETEDSYLVYMKDIKELRLLRKEEVRAFRLGPRGNIFSK